ncbi:MAG: hypothetical protein V1828_01890 [Candidatus Omnitrophota bacterium]
MEEPFGELPIFQVIRIIIFWTSPVIFLVGLFLIVTAERYAKLEDKLGREIGGIRKRVIPKLETNIFTFHQWLLKKNVIVGCVYIACAILFFFFAKGSGTH